MKRFAVLIVVSAMLLSLLGCSGKTPEKEQPARTVTDHAGNAVTLKGEVERIVVCDIYPLPSVLTVFLGSGDKLVGMAKQSMIAARAGLLGELYPTVLNAKTDFIDGTNVNIEELMSLKPDIVFYNAGNKALGESLKNAGIAGFAFSAGKWGYDPIETMYQWILSLDQIFPESGKAEAFKKYANGMKEKLQAATGVLSSPASVFFLFQYSDAVRLTAGNPSFGQKWCDMISALHLIQEKTEQNSMPFHMEQLYAWDPDVIFVTNFTTVMPAEILSGKVGNDDWSPLSAVKNKRVYKLPLGIYRSYTAGVDAPIAMAWMAKAVYPNLYEDVDILEETKKYYEEVFEIKLTDAQAERIFNPDVSAGAVAPVQ